MANVFEGDTDDRQSKDTKQSISRFRPKYRALTDDEKSLHDEIKNKASELEELFGRVVSLQSAKGRYYYLAIEALELAIMWIVKELTA